MLSQRMIEHMSFHLEQGSVPELHHRFDLLSIVENHKIPKVISSPFDFLFFEKLPSNIHTIMMLMKKCVKNFNLQV